MRRRTNPLDLLRLQWRRLRRYELTRTLRHTERRMAFVKASLASIDRAEGRSTSDASY